MPLGFFGTAIALIALAIAISFVYGMVWRLSHAGLPFHHNRRRNYCRYRRVRLADRPAQWHWHCGRSSRRGGRKCNIQFHAAVALLHCGCSIGLISGCTVQRVATFSVSRWFLMTQKLCPNPSLNADVRHAGLRPANGSPVSLFR